MAHIEFWGLLHPIKDLSICYYMAFSKDAASAATLGESLYKHPVTTDLTNDASGIPYEPVVIGK